MKTVKITCLISLLILSINTYKSAAQDFSGMSTTAGSTIICSGNNTTININGINGLTDGNYTVNYTMTGSNPQSATDASVTFSSGSCSYSIPVLNNSGLTTVTINKIGTASVASGNTANITVNASTSITAQSTATQTQCLGGAFSAISVTATGTGTITYQWYSNTSASTSGGTSLGSSNGAQTNSYTPQASAAGTLYYYCIVHSDCGSDITSSISGAFIVTPNTSITAQSTATQTQCQGGTFSAISVTASGAGTITYQWYSNTSSSTSGSASLGSSDGAQTNSYTPQTSSLGTLYYYCIVHSDCGSDITSSISGAFIVNPSTSITAQSTATQTLCQGGTFSAISVTATGTGTITYQWYSNTSASTSGGTSLGSSNGAQTNSYTPQATIAGTLYYYCIVHSDCGSDVTSSISGAFIVTPNTSITAQSTATQTQCQGGAFSAISVTATGTGTITYQWYSNTSASTSGGTSLGSSNGAQTNSYTPQASSPGTLYYYCIVHSDCGSDITSSISGAFIVNPSTSISAQSTATQTQCQGSSFTPVTVTATGTGTITYQWYSNTSASTTGGTSLGSSNGAQTNSYMPQTTTAGILFYYCVVHSNCGTDVKTAISGPFIVNPIPNMTSAAFATICSGSTVSITLTSNVASNYTWIATDNANITGESTSTQNTNTLNNTLTNTSTTYQNVTYTVTPTSTAGCLGSSQSVIVTVNPNGQVNTVPDQSYSDGNSASISFVTVNTGATTSYAWTNSATNYGLSSSSGSGNISFTASNNSNSYRSGNIVVTPTYSYNSKNCPGSNSTFIITVYPKAGITQPSPQVLCNGSPTTSVHFTTSLTGLSSVTFNWVNDKTSIGLPASGSGDISSFTAVNSGSSQVISTITITPYYCFGSNCFDGYATSYTYTVNPTPTISLAASTTPAVCSSASSQNTQLTYSATTNSPIKYFINWDPAALGAGLLNVDTTVLPGSPISVPIAAGAGVLGNTYNGTLKVKNSYGCISTTTTTNFTATIYSNPTVTITPASPTTCAGTWLMLTANPTGGSGSYLTHAWTGTDNSHLNATSIANPSFYSASPGTFSNLTYTVTDSHGCQASVTPITVNVNAAAGGGTINPMSPTICSGSNQILTLSGNTGNVAHWEMSTDSWLTTTIINNATNTLTATNVTTPVKYKALIQNGTCSSAYSNEVLISLYPGFTASASNNGPVCAKSTLNLSAQPNSMVSYAWTGPLTYTNGTQNPNRANATTSMAGTYSVTITDSYGCTSSASTNVTVNSLPSISITSPSQVVTNILKKDTAILLSGDRTGATFSGDGVTTSLGQYIFNPNLVNIPTGKNSVKNPIYYTYTDANHCTNTVVDTFNVLKTTAEFVNLKPLYCVRGTNANISVFDGAQTIYYSFFELYDINYNYIGSTTNPTFSFNPSTYGQGKYILYYFYYLDPSYTTYGYLQQQFTIEDAGIPAIIGLDSSYCDRDLGSHTLTANINTSAKGYWTGPKGDKLSNSSTYVLKPYLQSLTPGTTYQIVFTDTSANGCPSQTLYQNIKINPLPTVSILNDPIFNVTGNDEVLKGNNAGGKFTGLGVSEITNNVLYQFSPSRVGVNSNVSVKYTYADPVTQCSDSISKSFNVMAAAGSISNHKATTVYCKNENAHFTFTPPFSLTDSVYFQLDNNSTNNIHNGITDSSFSTSNLYSNQTHLARFFYKNGHSWFEKNLSFTIDSVYPGSISVTYPAITGKSKPQYACENITNKIYLIVSGASPSGGTGTWTGNVTNPSNLQAEVPTTDTGKFTIQYQYTSPSGCQSSLVYTKVKVLPLPVDSITNDSIYNIASNKNYLLTGSNNSSIISQTFSGTGVVNGKYFDPSNAGVGGFAIHYSYTSDSGCTNASTKNFTVLQATDTIIFTKNSCYSANVQPITINIAEANKSYNKSSVVFSTAHGYDNILKINNNQAQLTFTGNNFTNGSKQDTIIYSYKIGNASFSARTVYSIDSVFAKIKAISPNHFCANNGTIINLITDSIMPSGKNGTWTDDLNLITPNGNLATFDPSKITSSFNGTDITDNITFSYTSPNGCPSKPYSVKLYVHPKDSIAFGNIIPKHNYDKASNPIAIMQVPVGGSFSSKTLFIRNDSLVPQASSVGAGDLNYTYNYKLNSFNCTASKTDSINIIAAAVTYHFPNSGQNTNVLCYWGTSNVVPFTITLNNNSIPDSDEFLGVGVIKTDKEKATIDLRTASLKSNKGNITITYRYKNSDGYTWFSVPQVVYIDSIDGSLSLSFDTKSKLYCAVANDSNIINANVHTPGKGIFYIQDDSLANHHIRTTSNYLAAYFHPWKLINDDSDKHSYGDKIKVNYLFTSNYGCTKLATDTFVIHEQPHPQFTVPNTCFNKNAGIKFQNITNLKHDTVTLWNWNFGEATSNTELEAEPSPTFQYSANGPKTITLTATTQYCSNDTVAFMSIGLRPVSNFSWNDECFSKDGKSGKKIAFNNNSLDPTSGNDPIQKYCWNVSGKVDTVTNKLYTFSFPKPDDYTISLKVITKNNCVDSLTKTIHIRPWINVNDQSFYSENFSNGNGGWFGNLDSTSTRSILTDDSIWKLGSNARFTPPTGETKVWYTQLNQTLLGKLDTVWVASPCMDFTGIKKPMIELKIKKAFFQDVDGGVLQYTLDSTTTNPAWTNIGTINDGINWYNSSSIQGQPGGQFTGWSGSNSSITSFDSTWVDARHDLDVLKDKPFVRFRIAYGYKVTGNLNKGFGFTDISIRNREKVVLLEDFTSNTISDNFDNYISKYNQYDILDVRYHTTGDEFYSQYASGPNAKALFYQVSSTPNAIANGNITNSVWKNSDTITKLSLQTPKFAIELKTTKTSLGIDVNTSLTALENISVPSIILNIAIIENQAKVTGSSVTYKNVLRKLLPDPSGTLYTNWQVGAPLKADYNWQYTSSIDPTNVKVVAFVQNSITKEIYQATTDDSAFNATDIAPKIRKTDNEFSIYPNPADGETYILFSQPLENPVNMEIFNNVGILVSNINISSQTQIFNFNTTDLKNGFYFLKLSNGKVSKSGKLIISR